MVHTARTPIVAFTSVGRGGNHLTIYNRKHGIIGWSSLNIFFTALQLLISVLNYPFVLPGGGMDDGSPALGISGYGPSRKSERFCDDGFFNGVIYKCATSSPPCPIRQLCRYGIFVHESCLHSLSLRTNGKGRRHSFMNCPIPPLVLSPFPPKI